ncbi:P-loop containing nucleoside triphosphate hydrolase protein [Chytridium lagenaria]|nr:P-loop containing nucleoside triphosphate hydrolase protein [Chytridium lagenaria]
MAEEEKGSASQSASQDDEVEDVDEETVDAEEEALKPSSKVDKIVEILGEELAKDSTTKAVIFSQWSKMLDVIAPFLKKAGINFVRFDGSMSRNARANSIRAFQTDPGTTVFLATLKSAGFGLNLVAGNLAFIVDPWWNGSVETQALDRINRLGQTRPVKIVRLVISGSVEERVLLVQERKRLVSSQAFDEEGKGKGKMESRESRMDDLKLLLGKGSEGSV